MRVRRPVLDLPDFPIRLRYDSGEDLDECCENGRVVFTQCKRMANIGQAAGLASGNQRESTGPGSHYLDEISPSVPVLPGNQTAQKVLDQCLGIEGGNAA